MDLVKVVVEILGTFFFLSVILQTLTDTSIGPIAVAVTLLAAIYFGASSSGAHFNPAVSFAMLTIYFKIITLKHLVIFVLFTKEARKNFK